MLYPMALDRTYSPTLIRWFLKEGKFTGPTKGRVKYRTNIEIIEMKQSDVMTSHQEFCCAMEGGARVFLSTPSLNCVTRDLHF
jgi:hypothetical protein